MQVWIENKRSFVYWKGNGACIDYLDADNAGRNGAFFADDLFAISARCDHSQPIR
jgi:hypothetical protein